MVLFTAQRQSVVRAKSAEVALRSGVLKKERKGCEVNGGKNVPIVVIY